jgi:dolichyl-phosphate beta-glucosyltransferase
VTNHPAPKDGISIVIPSYNEAKRIGSTIRAIEDYAEKAFSDWEVLVVDDGSADDTAAVARASIRDANRLIVVNNPGNRGKGFSTKNGCAHARFPYVLMSDADLSTPIEEIEKLAPYAAPDTVVIASRGMHESNLEVRQPFYREMMGRVFNLLVRMFVISGISDTQCGFKLFGPDIVRNIMPALETDRFAFDVEILARARRMGYRIHEVPVRWRNDDRTRVSALSDSVKMFKDMLAVRRKVNRVPMGLRPAGTDKQS